MSRLFTRGLVYKYRLVVHLRLSIVFTCGVVGSMDSFEAFLQLHVLSPSPCMVVQV
jgi:hypothetical protein